MKCGLCHKTEVADYALDEKRQWRYLKCLNCDLVFRDPETYLPPEEEKKRYETHNNSIENKGYVRFLSPVIETLLPYLNEGDEGLDYGAGPGPILDILFAEKGFKVSNYDPYFATDKTVLERTYDFVTCTEAIEHFYEAYEGFTQMEKIVNPGGYLLLMTDRRPDDQNFLAWGYRMDNTHVCFYSTSTFHWLACHWGFDVVSSEGKLTLLRKKS